MVDDHRDRRLAGLREVAPAERYNGPVLFEGQAAAELFAQGFAPRLLASRIPDEIVEDNKRIKTPEALKAYHVFTNDVEMANKLLADPGVIKIFFQFKNN